MASRKVQGKKKGTTITLGQLHNINSTPKPPPVEESWEDKEFDNIKPLNNSEQSQHRQFNKPAYNHHNHHNNNRHHQTSADTGLEAVKLPDGLTWEERQDALMAIDEEEAKKSPFYCNNFDDMGVNELILRGIYSYGFESPSRVQSRAIKAITTKKDCIVQAQSGTGKTGTFVIGTLNNIDFSMEHVQAVVLAPTRELADQIYKVFSNISQYCNICVSLCVGQMRVDDSINKSQIIVGTTGRILDSIERKVIDVSRISMLVMDEADEMLSPGFKEQVVEIYKHLPKEGLQVCLFSATLAPEVMMTAGEITKDPLNVLIRQEFVTLKGISQFFVNCIREEYKLDTLLDIYKRYMCTQSIVYVNSKNKCCWLASELIRRNHTVLYIDSSMNQRERSRIMREFRQGTCRILITTNLLSRGIDVQGVNLVINYDLPGTNNIESYVHRIGRCGRYGRKGVAINFITPNDYYIIQNIRRYYSTEINELPEDISGAMTY
jgi:superfamily II DNA/RNA helicase